MNNDSLKQKLIEVTRAAQEAELSPFFRTLSSARLSREYEVCDWAIGPFERIESLTFDKKSVWRDPWDIGWQGNSIHNACLIEQDAKLYMFYRCNPSMESLSSRIGLAVYEDAVGWVDCEENPILYSTLDNENLGCEDPKVYRAEGKYFLFYEAVFAPTDQEREQFGDAIYPVGPVGCEINLAESSDLIHWEKLGPILPRSISHLWAKSGLILRDGRGNALKVDGRYMMFVSEGCGGKQVIGTSADMRHWDFTYRTFLDTSPLGTLFEVMSFVTESENSENLVMDFFYNDGSGIVRGGEALYHKTDPTRQIALNRGGTLNVGGLLRYKGRWVHAQGWDAPHGKPVMYLYGTEPSPAVSE